VGLAAAHGERAGQHLRVGGGETVGVAGKHADLFVAVAPGLRGDLEVERERRGLDEMRVLLLKSEARKAINMLDVPEGEPGVVSDDKRFKGKDWRAQLLASGVPKYPSKFGMNARLSAGDGKPEEPEPDVPPLRVGNPVPPAWDDRPIRKGRQDPVPGPLVQGEGGAAPTLWTPDRAMVAGIGAFGALFAAGWAVSKVYKRKSGPL